MMKNLPESPNKSFHVDTTRDKFGQIFVIFGLPLMKMRLLLNNI
jgi:hypothetical protein